MRLDSLLIESARRCPEAIAVLDGEDAITYGELDRSATAIAGWLLSAGVQPGDRVGIWTAKSWRAIAAMQAVLRIDAAYVPLDATGPVSRGQTIVEDCAMSAVIISPDILAKCGEFPDGVTVLPGDAMPAHDAPGHHAPDHDALPELVAASGSPDDLAYILYTSGSTGRPKGVCISHRNARAFIDWSIETIEPRAGDVLSSHAPFHFDLSVFDIYAALATGSAIALVPELTAYAPTRLVKFIRTRRITIWYSVPSVIMLMFEHGKFESMEDLHLRAVLFAGEVLPIKYVQRLRTFLPSARLLNLYGPTETNVCTFYELGDEVPAEALPIGVACSGDRVWAVTSSGKRAQSGEEGELAVSGPTVFLGYWGHPRQSSEAYLTGDLVRLDSDGNYHYVGRRDHMVKVRGNRVELAEIESVVVAEPSITEAAAMVDGSGLSARLVVFVSSSADQPPTLMTMKRWCLNRLPKYMIPDRMVILDSLPKNRNGKIDRLALRDRFRDYRAAKLKARG